MLVQLDTGDIANLERLFLRDPEKCRMLIAEWNANGLALALNLHHAQEIAQHASTESRKRRLQIIELFEDIRFGGMAEFGVIRQEVAVLLDAVGNEEPARFEGLRDFFFPKSSAEDFAQYLLSNAAALQKMRVPIEQTIAVRTVPIKGKRTLKNRVLTPDSNAVAEARFRHELSKSSLSPSERRLAIEFYLGLAKSFDGQPNVRAALELHYGLKGIKWVAGCPDSDLSLAASFADTARELLIAGRGILPQTPSEDELINGIDPYSAPGVRIQFALHRAQTAAGSPKPAHETDRSHAVFAPYVNVIFLDRQTATFLEQESRRAPHLLPQTDLQTVRPSGPIEQLMQRTLAQHRTNGSAT
jgi:hypothetical protein